MQNREISCPINREDKRSRVRHLQLSGLSTRALSEIESLESKLAKEDKYYYDKLLADFHIQDGHVQEALDILLPHYVKQKNNFDYLNSLAKAAARAGELSTAVNAYYSVYKLSPSSRKGRFALFQTAFLSYQFQDYDGASRRFNEFVNKYAKSGLSLDAKWHLAWIRYLKSDFQGAYDQFTMLSKTANSFRRQDRIVYWRAMSLMRMNRYKDAEKLFKELSDNESYSFYALAAKSRLLQFKSQMQERQLAGLNSELNMIELSGSEDVNAVQASEGKLPAVSESQESEENISAISSSEEMNEASEESAESTDNAIAEESKDNSETSDIAFTQPILQEKFSRAQWLKKLAFNDYSRWELFEIEKRSKQKNHLKNLMSEYQSIGAYHRSSYIGQIHFGREQQQLGMKAVKSLWEFTFPQSYKNFVSKYANEYGIPNEMIWAIMRAESHYKADVKSQVGAMGLMQLMPYTAEKLARIAKVKNPSIDDLLQPEINIQLGARYLKRLAVKYDSKIPLVAAAYNAGPHRVDSWLYSFGRIDMDEFIEHIPFLETRNYAKQVFRNFMVYQSLYSGESKAEALGLAMLSQNVGVQSTSGITAKEDWVTEY